MKDLVKIIKKKTDKIGAIRLGLTSPEMICSRSHGEVKKSETINYRTGKPERDGLFCPRIFGPVKKYECLCGKYRKYKHSGKVCEKCGVEITVPDVRRERAGHIDLACPIAHIWFLRSTPSRIATYLGMTASDLEKVVYFESYIVIDPGMTNLSPCQVISEEEDREYRAAGEDFETGMGAEAIHKVLKKMDREKEMQKIEEDLEKTSSDTKIKKLTKRLRLLKAFRNSGNKPEWMILKVLPVLPPALRPLIPLEGGRFASSDLNDLYRRVTNRNNRLKELMKLGAPEIILRNEKRMLQESVDALLDSSRRPRVTAANARAQRSLSDMIKGKHGRFRQHLLGKRVDYSGRSVIVVGPTLKLHQCGLPKKMALEMFKPFLYRELQRREHAQTLKSARRLVEDERPEVWDCLATVINQHPILLNRAPTLHRLGIQAFEPILVEGKAIQLHPLVCAAYNADFDGDQMAVHIPLSLEAQLEARILMMASNNILSPANGDPIIVPSQDVVLGLYYMTRERVNARGEGMKFAHPQEARRAFESGCLDLHAKVKVRIPEKFTDGGLEVERNTLVDTTVGRVLLFDIIPQGLPFATINKVMNKQEISSAINQCYWRLGIRETVIFADRLMYKGFEYSTRSGLSICVDDFAIPEKKYDIIKTAEKEVEKIEDQFNSGLVSEGEKYNKTVDIWTHAGKDISTAMMENLRSEKVKDRDGKEVRQDSFNPVYVYADSGARGSAEQLRQLAGMRGLMSKPDGTIIETPITANFREGLSVLQYFISTHGARKGLADTALKTSSAGYLTRRLVDVAQDVVVMQEDCGTREGLDIKPDIEAQEVSGSLQDSLLGRITLEDVRYSTGDGEVLVPADTMLDRKDIEIMEKEGIGAKVRSVIFCEAKRGICAKCYGRDLSRGHLVNIGEAVGIIAAQSIGEPGTQLTMRTFHMGGVASGTTVENRVEVRNDGFARVQGGRFITRADGNKITTARTTSISVLNEHGREQERYALPHGAVFSVQDGDSVRVGDVIAEWDPHVHSIIIQTAGCVRFENMEEGRTVRHQLDPLTGQTSITVIPKAARATTAQTQIQPAISLVDEEGNLLKRANVGVPEHYQLPDNAIINVENGQQVQVGDVLARVPQESSRSGDITGGLPRVAELFEARHPKEAAILAEASGVLRFEGEVRNKRKLLISSGFSEEDGEGAVLMFVSKDRIPLVYDGEEVSKGEVIVEGALNPHDILKLRGVEALATFMVKKIQTIYRLQGVKIHDKHIEVILRQMLTKVEVTEPGDSEYLPGEQSSLARVKEENEELLKNKKKPIEYQRVLLGLTKAAVATESFIAAASFQETTKVLTEAVVHGKRDELRWLKENIIIGQLIPAGTGFRHHQERTSLQNLEEMLDTTVEPVEDPDAKLAKMFKEEKT